MQRPGRAETIGRRPCAVTRSASINPPAYFDRMRFTFVRSLPSRERISRVIHLRAEKAAGDATGPRKCNKVGASLSGERPPRPARTSPARRTTAVHKGTTAHRPPCSLIGPWTSPRMRAQEALAWETPSCAFMLRKKKLPGYCWLQCCCRGRRQAQGLPTPLYAGAQQLRHPSRCPMSRCDG